MENFGWVSPTCYLPPSLPNGVTIEDESRIFRSLVRERFNTIDILAKGVVFKGTVWCCSSDGGYEGYARGIGGGGGVYSSGLCPHGPVRSSWRGR